MMGKRMSRVGCSTPGSILLYHIYTGYTYMKMKDAYTTENTPQAWNNIRGTSAFSYHYIYICFDIKNVYTATLFFSYIYI